MEILTELVHTLVQMSSLISTHLDISKVSITSIDIDTILTVSAARG